MPHFEPYIGRDDKNGELLVFTLCVRFSKDCHFETILLSIKQHIFWLRDKKIIF